MKKRLLLIVGLAALHFLLWLTALRLSIGWMLESGFNNGSTPLRNPTLAERVLIPMSDTLSLPLSYCLNSISSSSISHLSDTLSLILLFFNSLIWGMGVYFVIGSTCKVVSRFKSNQRRLTPNLT